MPQPIMVPVDLAHEEALEKAIAEAGHLAKRRGTGLTLVGVTGTGTTAAAHNPAEYAGRLQAFGETVAERTGCEVETISRLDNDVAVDLGSVLIDVSREIEADVIVMASHIPGFIEHIFASNAGYVASHAACSVYVVR